MAWDLGLEPTRLFDHKLNKISYLLKKMDRKHLQYRFKKLWLLTTIFWLKI